jgi:DNA-binding transcriptional MerR regulator
MKKRDKRQAEITTLGQSLPSGKESGKQYFTVPELISLTSMSRKQVNYWAKIGLLTPTMRSTKRAVGKPVSFYSRQDVLRALVICDMRRRGISTQQVQKVIHNLEKEGLRLDESSKYLLTDGYSVYYAKSDTELIDILKHNRQMIFVSIHEQVEKLRKAA